MILNAFEQLVSSPNKVKSRTLKSFVVNALDKSQALTIPANHIIISLAKSLGPKFFCPLLLF